MLKAEISFSTDKIYILQVFGFTANSLGEVFFLAFEEEHAGVSQGASSSSSCRDLMVGTQSCQQSTAVLLRADTQHLAMLCNTLPFPEVFLAFEITYTVSTIKRIWRTDFVRLVFFHLHTENTTEVQKWTHVLGAQG